MSMFMYILRPSMARHARLCLTQFWGAVVVSRVQSLNVVKVEKQT